MPPSTSITIPLPCLKLFSDLLNTINVSGSLVLRVSSIASDISALVFPVLCLSNSDKAPIAPSERMFNGNRSRDYLIDSTRKVFELGGFLPESSDFRHISKNRVVPASVRDRLTAG
jgi:hypothetical protein